MIATSQAYESKASTTKGIESRPTAEIDDQRAEAIPQTFIGIAGRWAYSLLTSGVGDG